MKIKNEATEKKCQEIADMYWKDGHVAAMKHFNEWSVEQKHVHWVYIAIVERIKEIILQKKK